MPKKRGCDFRHRVSCATELYAAGLVVVPVDRPVLNLKCYIREYTTAAFGNDTIHMFGEYMADYFLVEQKVKGFKTDNKPKVRASRKRIRHKNASGLDSTAIPAKTAYSCRGSPSVPSTLPAKLFLTV